MDVSLMWDELFPLSIACHAEPWQTVAFWLSVRELTYLDAASNQIGDVLLTAALKPMKDEVPILFHLQKQVDDLVNKWTDKSVKNENNVIIKSSAFI